MVGIELIVVLVKLIVVVVELIIVVVELIVAVVELVVVVVKLIVVVVEVGFQWHMIGVVVLRIISLKDSVVGEDKHNEILKMLSNVLWTLLLMEEEG